MNFNKKNVIVGLDRDGTINEDIGTYVANTNDFVPILRSLEAISIIKHKGYKTVIITNQAGIYKGTTTESEVNLIHQHMKNLLNQFNTDVDKIYFSKTNLEYDNLAKPNIGLFKLAEQELNARFKNGFYVGDKLSDLQAAYKIDAVPVLVKTGYGKKTLREINSYQKLKEKTLIFDSLIDFALFLPIL